MDTIDYFKLQAKNLHRDFKTKTPVVDKTTTAFLYEYTPKYFDVEMVIGDFDIDEESFTLMNAQHVIAKIANFDKWGELLKAEPAELELAKLLYDYQNRVDLIGWQFYIADAQSMNQEELDAEIQVDIFKKMVIEENIFDYMEIKSYLLKHHELQISNFERDRTSKNRALNKKKDWTTKEVIIKDKQKYLDENYPFGEIPKLTDKKSCIHCGNIITVDDYKVFIDDLDSELIFCPNAPKCDGTVIDWLPVDFQKSR